MKYHVGDVALPLFRSIVDPVKFNRLTVTVSVAVTLASINNPDIFAPPEYLGANDAMTKSPRTTPGTVKLCVAYALAAMEVYHVC